MLATHADILGIDYREGLGARVMRRLDGWLRLPDVTHGTELILEMVKTEPSTVEPVLGSLAIGRSQHEPELS